MINENIFKKEKDWKIVQNHIREFGNQLNISKEMIEESVGEKWYNQLHQSFYDILASFTENQE